MAQYVPDLFEQSRGNHSYPLRQRLVKILLLPMEMMAVHHPEHHPFHILSVRKNGPDAIRRNHKPVLKILLPQFFREIEMQHHVMHNVALRDAVYRVARLRIVVYPLHGLVIELHRTSAIDAERRGRKIVAATRNLEFFQFLHHLRSLHYRFWRRIRGIERERIIFMPHHSLGVKEIELQEET